MIQQKEIDITRVGVGNLTFFGDTLFMRWSIIDGDNTYDMSWKGRVSCSDEKGVIKPTTQFQHPFNTYPFDELLRMKDGYIETNGNFGMTQRYKLNENGDKVVDDTDVNYVFFIGNAITQYSENNVISNEEGFSDICFLFPKNEENSVIFRDKNGVEHKKLVVFSEQEKKKIQEAIIRYLQY